jgi:hypothetical protein
LKKTEPPAPQQNVAIGQHPAGKGLEQRKKTTVSVYICVWKGRKSKERGK